MYDCLIDWLYNVITKYNVINQSIIHVITKCRKNTKKQSVPQKVGRIVFRHEVVVHDLGDRGLTAGEWAGGYVMVNQGEDQLSRVRQTDRVDGAAVREDEDGLVDALLRQSQPDARRRGRVLEVRACDVDNGHDTCLWIFVQLQSKKDYSINDVKIFIASQSVKRCGLDSLTRKSVGRDIPAFGLGRKREEEEGKKRITPLWCRNCIRNQYLP